MGPCLGRLQHRKWIRSSERVEQLCSASSWLGSHDVHYRSKTTSVLLIVSVNCTVSRVLDLPQPTVLVDTMLGPPPVQPVPIHRLLSHDMPPPTPTTPRRSRAPSPFAACEHPMTPTPSGLTLAMYPDIADAILLASPYAMHATLRLTCRYFRDRIDAAHAHHIAMRTAMCRPPAPSSSSSYVPPSGVHLVVARPDKNVRHDTDRIYGYFYAGNAIPGLGYALAFNGAILDEPPPRQKALLKHTRVLDIYPNDIDWEFTCPRAQLEGAVAALDPAQIHTLRYGEEADPWWYTRALTPRTVVFDLRHFDAQRPAKHATYSYTASSARIPASAQTVIIHIPIARWRFSHAPLDAFVAHPGMERVVLLFRPVYDLDDHTVKWDGQAPPMGVLHKFLQDNRARFPALQLLIVGAENANLRVFGRAFPDDPRPKGGGGGAGEAAGGNSEGSVEPNGGRCFGDRLLQAVRDSAGTIGWSSAQVADAGECIHALTLDEYRASIDEDEWDLHTKFPHYPK